MSEQDTIWADRFIKRELIPAGELAKRFNILNPRLHPEAQRDAVEESLETLGWIDEPSLSTNGPNSANLADNPDAVLKDGHLRIELALLRGGENALVPVNWYFLTEKETELALSTQDPTSEMAEYDTDKLAALLERTRALTADRPGLGAMLERLKERAGINGNGQSDNGNEPSAPTEIEAEKYHKKWQVQPGEIWSLGQHLVACLDSLDEANIKRVVGDSTVTFAFADPPYGINIVAANGYVGGGEAYDIPFGGVTPVRNRGQANKGYVGGGARIKASPGLYPIQTWSKAKGLGSPNGAKPFGSKDKRVSGSDGAANIVDVGKYYPVAGDSTTETAKQSAAMLLSLYPGACHIWWGANYYTDVLSPSPCWIIWDKDNTGNFADCEMAWTNQPTAARIFEHRWNGMLKASEQGQRRIHPTQKPIALPRYCFETYGESGDVIIDPFLGSGITVLAAEELGDRRVIGFELEPVYVSTVLERWQQLTGQTPRRVSG